MKILIVHLPTLLCLTSKHFPQHFAVKRPTFSLVADHVLHPIMLSILIKFARKLDFIMAITLLKTKYSPSRVEVSTISQDMISLTSAAQ
jgi:hypothetical protein